MTFGQAVKTVLTTKYADFSGRATRSEYWWYQLFFSACLVVLFIPVVVAIATTPVGEDPSGSSLALLIGDVIVLGAFFLATLVPGLALVVRRLHDVGMPGWVYLVSLVPYGGGLFLLVVACLDSKPANRWGPNPKYTSHNVPGFGVPAVAELAHEPALPGATLTPAGWYTDPGGVARLRYWDGAAWTEHISH